MAELIEGADNLEGGLVTNVPSHLLRRSQSPDAINFDPSNQDGVTKRQGFTTYLASGDGGTCNTAGIIIARDTGVASGSKRVVVAATNVAGAWKLYDVTVAGWSPAGIPGGWDFSGATGDLSTFSYPVDLHMYDDLTIVLNKGGGPWKSIGSPVAIDLGAAASDMALIAGAQYGEIHKGRFWVSGRTASPTTIYWSDLHDPTSWTPNAESPNAGNETLNKNDGNQVNGMCSVGEVLYVSKISPETGTNPNGTEGSIYGLFGTDQILSSAIRKVANFPAVSHRAMIDYDGVLVCATPNGIFSVSGKGIALLSRDIQDLYESIPNKDSIQICRYRNQILFAYDSAGSSWPNQVNNRILVLDIGRGRWSHYTGTIGNISCMTNECDTGEVVFIGNGVNRRLMQYPVGTNDNGVAIAFHWSTPDLDWGDFFRDKQVKQFFLYTLDTGDFDLKLTRTLDGAPQTDTPNITVNVQGTGTIDKLVHRVVTPSGDRNSRFTRFKIENNELNEPITLRGFSCYANMLDATR